MHAETTPVRVTSIPFAPAVRWNLRTHLLLTDLAALTTIILVFTIATSVTWHGYNLIFGLHDLAILIAFALTAIGVLAALHVYDARHTSSLRRDLVLTVPAVLIGAAVAGGSGAYVKLIVEPTYGVASQLLAAGLIATTAMLFAARFGTHAAREWKPVMLQSEGRVLVLGEGVRAAAFASHITNADPLALEPEEQTTLGLATFEQAIREQLDTARPEQLVIAFDRPNAQLQSIAVREAVARDIPVRILPAEPEAAASGLIHNGVEPVEALVGARERQWQWQLKFAVDKVIAITLIALLSPLLVGVTLAIWLGDRGPVLYRQPRISLYGRPFGVWKFRSMRVDAAERLAELLSTDPAAREEWDRDQKLRSDPRITRVGEFIRKWSIDELPQLLNVLTGEMSLVGPRPPMPNQLSLYGTQFVFGKARPGMTGLWQVSGRNKLTFVDRVEIDNWYVENWSLWLDLRISLRTIMVVLTRDGAC